MGRAEPHPSHLNEINLKPTSPSRTTVSILTPGGFLAAAGPGKCDQITFTDFASTPIGGNALLSGAFRPPSPARRLQRISPKRPLDNQDHKYKGRRRARLLQLLTHHHRCGSRAIPFRPSRLLLAFTSRPPHTLIVSKSGENRARYRASNNAAQSAGHAGRPSDTRTVPVRSASTPSSPGPVEY